MRGSNIDEDVTHPSAGTVHMQDPIFVINLAADVLAPQGAMSSVGTRMTISLHTFPQFD